MIRLNKFIANAGVCTRKEADVLISSGKIKVNQQVVNSLGFKLNDGDVVEYKGKEIKKERLIYLLLNKAKNTSLKEGFLKELSVLGELDEKTTGLTVLSNDDSLIKRLSNPNALIKQKYIIHIQELLSNKHIKELLQGIKVKEEKVVFNEIKHGKKTVDHHQIIVTVSFVNINLIREALNALNVEVLYMDRVEYGGIRKGDLLRGQTRNLELKEIGFLKMAKI
ncbi:MAG: S4 domain-containing protein [Flavobacteriales bacterium]|nr:S4 domain-containing protein [Flavobacteriales bacterium]